MTAPPAAAAQSEIAASSLPATKLTLGGRGLLHNRHSRQKPPPPSLADHSHANKQVRVHIRFVFEYIALD